MSNQGIDPKFTVQTPEQIEFEYELAGLGSRLLAFLFDGMIRLLMNLILVMLFFVVLIIGGIIQGGASSAFQKISEFFDKSSRFPLLLFAIIWFVMWLINTGYYIFFETVWSGQTPGKKLLNIRVIREGGYPVGFYEALLRNLLRIIDIIPTNYLVGALCVFISPKEKRVGDYAAGTIVIKEKVDRIPEGMFKESKPDSDLKELRGVLPNIVNVKPEEYNMIVGFLERREEMDSSYRRHMGQVLTDSLAKKLDFKVPDGLSHEEFLERFAEIYRREMKFL